MQYHQVLSSDKYTNYIKDPFNRDKTMTYLRETLPHSRVKVTKGDTSFPPYDITFESLSYKVGLLEKQVFLLMLDITMHIYLCQNWCIISLLSSRTMSFTIILVKLKKLSLSISSKGMGMLQEQTLIVRFMGHMETTQTCRIWPTSITVTIGIESFWWQCSWLCYSMLASCMNPVQIQICLSQQWTDLIMAWA